jgi:hypothetical protein
VSLKKGGEGVWNWTVRIIPNPNDQQLGPHYALMWIKHIKQDDVRRQMGLARLLKTLNK